MSFESRDYLRHILVEDIWFWKNFTIAQAGGEQSVNNLLPNTRYLQGLVRATSTKTPRVR